MNALQALGIHYEYHYAILPTALPNNFVLFKKKHFYSTKIILGIKELKTYNEKLCTVFVYLTFHILLLGLKSFIIILALEIIGA